MFRTEAERSPAGLAARDSRVAATLAAGLLAFAALALGSVGWSLAVLPAVRSLSPADVPTAARLSGTAPLLLLAAAAHAVAAFLAASDSDRRRIASAVLAAGAALVATVLAAFDVMYGASSAAAVPALLVLAAMYGSVFVLERSSIRRPS